MADTKHYSEDERVLHEMGYAQELSRRMGPFQSFAISFSIICIISGGLASFPIAIGTGGPWMATIGWIIGGVFALIVAASLGQIASAYPTAGSLYHWSSILGGRFWGWLTALINLLGLAFVIPAVNVILYTFIKDLFFAGMLGWDVSTWTNTTMFVWVGIITAAQCLLNHLGIKLTTMLTDFSGYLILVVTALLVILLFTHIPSFNLGDAFTWKNTTGDVGSNVAPGWGWFMALLMGLLYPLFTITGFDASAHTSEETVDARNTVHKGMMSSVFWSLVAGFIMATAMVLALPAIYTTLAADPAQTVIAKEKMAELAAIAGGPKPADMAFLGWGAFTTLFNTLIMPSFLGKLVALGIIIANFCCALSAVTSTSRMVYAFARDGGLPRFLASVDQTYRTPQAAIWFTGVVSFLLTLITTPLGAFVALSTGCAVYLYVSYAMPILAGLFAEGKTWTTFGSFRLGGMSKLFAWITGLGVLGAVIGGHAFVPSIAATETTGFIPGLWYYSLGYLILCGLLWLGFANSSFKGPPTGDEIKRRQAEIAAREAALEGRTVALAAAATPAHSSGGGVAAATAAVTAAAAAASVAPGIRSSLQSASMSAEEVKANAERAAAARAAAEKAAAERLAAARRHAEAAARERTAQDKARVSAAKAASEVDDERTIDSPAPAKRSRPASKAKVSKPKAKVAKSTTAAKPRKAAKRSSGGAGLDITLVDGIGPKFKRELAALGVGSVGDLAKLSSAEIRALDSKIARDADQIADWISQAKDLLAGKAPRAAVDKARKAAKK
jgi:amino acid transporter/predicted flap endonuclease-1-like 5' DNA nuclease